MYPVGTMTPPQSACSKVIIFDWDDTICPSSFVDQWKVDCFKDLPLHFQNLFNEIGKCAEKCLDAAAKHGEVFIITNSDDGWVKFSAERFVPNLLPVISRYRIISARTRYERFYPGQPLCWKAAAFAHEVNEIFTVSEKFCESTRERVGSNDSDTLNNSCDSMVSTDYSSDSSNGTAESERYTSTTSPRSKASSRSPSTEMQREIVSFGDSMEERTAVKIVAGQLSSVPKSVMFITNPTPIQLIGQLAMLTTHMRFVCEHSSSLDLEISPQQAQKCAESIIKRHTTLSFKPRVVDSLPQSPRTLLGD